MNRQTSVNILKAISYIGIYGGLLIPLIFVPVVIFPFVFSKLIFYQVLVGLTFPAYIALAWAEPKYRPRWSPLYIAVLAYFVAVGLSVIFAADVQRAWWGNQERMNGLFTVLHFFLWFTMATGVLRTWNQWKKVLIYEVVLSGIMASVALLQLVYPKLLKFPAGPRVGGLLDNPIYMAGYQIFNLMFIALLWMKMKHRTFRLFLLAVALLDAWAFIAAQSRGALVGLFVAIGVFSLTYALLTPNKKTKFGVLGLAAFAVVSYGIVFALKDTSLIMNTPLRRFTDLSGTTETRFIAWKIGWQGFLERPLTGWGFDNFHILFNKNYNPKSLEFGYYETWFDRAHNTVIDMLAMTGIFGFLTYFAIFGALFYTVLRAYRKRWIDVPTASIFIGLPLGYFMQNFFVFDQPAGFTMSYLMFAIVASMTYAGFAGIKDDAEDKVEDKKQMKAVPWIAYGLIQLVALFVVYRTSVLPAQASYYSIKSNNYFMGRGFDIALVYAKKASTIPTPYLDEQTFLQSRNLITLVESNQLEQFKNWREWHDLIIDLNERHLKDHPDNTHPHFIYARFLHAMSRYVPEDSAKAEVQYLESVRTSPKRQQLQYSLARYYLENNRKEEGLDTFKLALEFNPNIGESHWYVGLSELYDFGQREIGAGEIIQAFKVRTPYQLKDVREAVAAADAYTIMGDKEGLKTLIPKLPNLSGGSVPYYLEIARSCEKLDLMEERNLILGALQKADPTLSPRLEPLQNGSATSIDDSLRLTEAAAQAAAEAAQTQTLATSSAPVQPSSGGAGPRK
ncbi:MAG: O-antigen ligase [Patescibacteria group bacterium]|nr:O-antigen ligase [Patescibacteria group bacterium]